MSDTNEQTLPKRLKKPVRQFFTMEHWQDENIARKHIKTSFEDIRASLKDAGIKTQFRKERGSDGIQTYAIFYGRPETVKKKDGSVEKKIVFSDHDYLAIHFDPSRKFPRPGRKKKEDS